MQPADDVLLQLNHRIDLIPHQKKGVSSPTPGVLKITFLLLPDL